MIDSSCAGKDCTQQGTITLRIAYLDLIGDFCEGCAARLEQKGLATKEEKGREPASLSQQLVPKLPVPQVAAQRSLTP